LVAAIRGLLAKSSELSNPRLKRAPVRTPARGPSERENLGDGVADGVAVAHALAGGSIVSNVLIGGFNVGNAATVYEAFSFSTIPSAGISKNVQSLNS
jgi:hypothetical protein